MTEPHTTPSIAPTEFLRLLEDATISDDALYELFPNVDFPFELLFDATAFEKQVEKPMRAHRPGLATYIDLEGGIVTTELDTMRDLTISDDALFVQAETLMRSIEQGKPLLSEKARASIDRAFGNAMELLRRQRPAVADRLEREGLRPTHE